MPLPGVPSLWCRCHWRHWWRSIETVIDINWSFDKKKCFSVAPPEQRTKSNGVHPQSDGQPKPRRNGRHPPNCYSWNFQEKMQRGSKPKGQVAQNNPWLFKESKWVCDAWMCVVPDCHKHISVQLEKCLKQLRKHPVEHHLTKCQKSNSGQAAGY